MTAKTSTAVKARAGKGRLRTWLRWVGIGLAALWLLAAMLLVAAKWIDPPTTAVHMERRMQAWMDGKPYHERYEFLPLSQISPNLQHAVIAAEDARFYQHHGFDWHQSRSTAAEDMEGGRVRGRVHAHAAAGEEFVSWNGALDSAQGSGGHAGAGGGAGAGEAADSGAVPERGGMGSGSVWSGGGVPVSLWDFGAEYWAGSGGAAGGDFAGSAEATAGADESVQRDHPEQDEPGGLVIAGMRRRRSTE